MSTAVRLLTYDDLCQTPDDGKRYEIIDGELIVSAAPKISHQQVLGSLYGIVWSFLQVHPLGMVFFAPFDVRLSPHDVVEPDLLFIRQDRLDILESGRYAMGPPDLVVEVISRSSRRIDPGAKLRLYARSGIPEYWLVDPERRRFQLFVLKEGSYEETPAGEDSHLRSEVIAGLELDPGPLFAGLL